MALYYLLGAFLFFTQLSGQEIDMPIRDQEEKIDWPKGVEPENDYNNDYDLLEDDNDDDEEDN